MPHSVSMPQRYDTEICACWADLSSSFQQEGSCAPSQCSFLKFHMHACIHITRQKKHEKLTTENAACLSACCRHTSVRKLQEHTPALRFLRFSQFSICKFCFLDLTISLSRSVRGTDPCILPCGVDVWMCTQVQAVYQCWVVGPDLIEQFIFSGGNLHDY